ncbi:hypothetical protein Rcae01_06651 [Novipirellula caenicola]|uniref:Uncharacterized protein n=1 Tax=Novipirellula caenicola TaxID=1536901 RepID=A0ABP9W1B1_9BACT
MLDAIRKKVDFFMSDLSFAVGRYSPLLCCGGEQALHCIGASGSLLNLKGTFTNLALKTNIGSL